MPEYFPDLDNAELADWSKVVESDLRWKGILLGNGSSRAVWDGFSYPSLYDRACSADVANPLLAEDTALFEAFWHSQLRARPGLVEDGGNRCSGPRR